MPVNTECQEYLLHRPEWSIVRKAIDGERAVKFGDVETVQSGQAVHRYDSFIPRPAGMENEDWDAYLSRAHWFGATGRTAHGLHGMLFSKAPTKTKAEGLDDILANVDLAGNSLDQFASEAAWDLLPTNWGGILADYPTTGEGMDKATSEKAGNRAYLAYYCAESIINWRYDKRNNATVLSLVVLKEPYNAETDDRFTVTEKNKYRVLELDENGDYCVSIYDEAVSLDVPSEGPYYPTMGGKKLKTLPFYPVPGNQPEKSMLLDLAYENIGHFQKTADYENGLHYTGVPTPYATKQGVPKNAQGEDEPVQLGGSRFLFFPEAETVGYLEFQGAGMDQEAKALQACEERMAILGARIISAEKKGVESADAARIHRAGENAVLATFANNLSRAITQAVRLLAQWQGIQATDFTYELNTDYDVATLATQALTAYVGAWQAGAMPKSVLFYNLQAGEQIPPDMSFEDFEAELEADGAQQQEAQVGKLAALAKQFGNTQTGAVPAKAQSGAIPAQAKKGAMA